VEQVEAQAARIPQLTVATPTMPLGNLTGMTPDERDLLDRWYRGLVDNGKPADPVRRPKD
jgi:uncharacterized membrane protein